jgi:hypothetical protein
MSIPMAPSGIEPANFWFVAQWLTFSTETISACVMSSKYDYDMITKMRTKKLVFMIIMINTCNNDVDDNLGRKA